MGIVEIAKSFVLQLRARTERLAISKQFLFSAADQFSKALIGNEKDPVLLWSIGSVLLNAGTCIKHKERSKNLFYLAAEYFKLSESVRPDANKNIVNSSPMFNPKSQFGSHHLLTPIVTACLRHINWRTCLIIGPKQLSNLSTLPSMNSDQHNLGHFS